MRVINASGKSVRYRESQPLGLPVPAFDLEVSAKTVQLLSKKEEKTGNECGYKHHKTCGEFLGQCKIHKVDLICTPFNCPVCPKCEGQYQERCGNCGALRSVCCC